MLSKRLFSDGLIDQQGNYETANLVVERFITTTVKAIKERAIWLDDFFRFPQFSITQGDGEKRYREKEQQMIAFIEEGTEVINELILRHDEGLIHEACLYTLLHVEKNIQLGQLASNLFVTKNHISNLFKRETGITLGQYISKVKVERAKILLSDSILLTYEISLKLGYKDAEYFSKVFKKYTGITPTAYQAGDA